MARAVPSRSRTRSPASNGVISPAVAAAVSAAAAEIRRLCLGEVDRR